MSFALACRISGPTRGLPIATLHGLFASAANWKPLEAHLPELRWHHLDLRNHGRSPHADTMTYDDMAGDVLSTISGLDHPVLLGHSLGGKVAMRCCELDPKRFSCLMVEDIAPILYPNHHRTAIEAMLSLPTAPGATRQSLEKHLLNRISDPALVRFLMTNLKAGPEGWSWRCNLLAISRSLSILLDYPSDAVHRPCQVPAYFIFGQNSPYRTPEGLEAMTSMFETCSRHDVAGAGHWVHHERPAEFADLLRQALAR